ncbi:MAG: HD domain-containing protein [Bacteroidota bacterium]
MKRYMQLSISEEKLADLKKWFTNYVHTFQYSEPEKQQNIDLKEDHTLRVCKEISNIGKQLGLKDDQLRLAEMIALLHDIGRFEQYALYHTFKDRSSENHAELGISIIEKFGLLESLDNNTTKNIIRCAIKYHNRHSLPLEESETCLFYSKLIRDADKLDIWKVVIDHYYSKEENKNGTVELELPDTPGFSEEVYNDLLNKNIVNMKYLRNLNDFKLFQAGWVFDINFQPTLDSIKKRRYIELIRDVLPESQKIDKVFDVIHDSF